MRETLKPLPYGNYLPSVYRFAFLMTGAPTAAAGVLRHVVEEGERDDLGEQRNSWKVQRWLFTCALAACRRPRAAVGKVPSAAGEPGEPFSPDPPVVGDTGDAPQQLALLFAGVPEAERAALALFYLYLFTPSELADVLEVKPDDLDDLLTEGRRLLQQQKAACEHLFAAA